MEANLTVRLPELHMPDRKKQAFWHAPFSLAIIQEKNSVAAVIFKSLLFQARIEAVFRRPFEGNLEECLTALHKDCLENGYGLAWTRPVKICLPDTAAVFQNFHLPPSSPRKARKTIPLLLDSEIPFNAGDYATQTVFTKDMGLEAIVTILPRAILRKWSETIEKFAIPEINLYIFPWPILASLPRTKAPCLLLCMDPAGSVICAINSSGMPLRIHTLLPYAAAGDGLINLIRQARLLAVDSSFQPQSVLVFGLANTAEIKKAITALFELPCLGLGDDIPLAGCKGYVQTDDLAPILAKCFHADNFFKNRKFPSFRLKFKRAKERNLPWLVPAAACLALAGGLDLLALANIVENTKKTENLRASMTEQLRNTLDNVPKNATPGRLTAILDSRLRELENNAPDPARHTVTAILENIHKVCPETLQIHLQRLTYDDRHIRLNGTANTYDEVNELKNRASSVPGVAEARIVNAAATRDKAHQFVEFELDLARGGE